MNYQELKLYENKLLVSELITYVLCSKITVREALEKFPNDKNDINIKCAFNALMHREADEEQREKIQDYKEIQDEFLAKIAEILKKNEPLPQNIIEKYNVFYENDIIYKKQNSLFKEIIESLKRNLNF